MNTILIKRFKFGGFRLDIDKPANTYFQSKVKNKVCYDEITGEERKAAKDYFFYFARTNNCNGLSGWTLLIWKLKFYLIYGEDKND